MLHTNIGKLAVEKKWLTIEQLQKCIILLDKSEGKKKLEGIFQENKLLTKDQIINLQQRRKVNIKKNRKPSNCGLRSQDENCSSRET